MAKGCHVTTVCLSQKAVEQCSTLLVIILSSTYILNLVIEAECQSSQLDGNVEYMQKSHKSKNESGVER